MESYCCCILLAYGSAVFSNTNTDVTKLCRINYALFEEIETEDIERTRDVYRYAKVYIHLRFGHGYFVKYHLIV